MLRREAVGRRFRSPLWRAQPPTRPPGLPPLVKEPIPCHHSQQQPKKPSQIQQKGILSGLGMLTRLRPPACRAVPARRAPNLPDFGVRHVAGEPIPCHHSQQQPKKPSQIQEKGILSGLGMLTRLRPPACRAVPARRAPNLADVGVRHVAGDGGGPPSAGLLPAGHRSTPATPPPVGLPSTFHGSDLRPSAGIPTSPSGHLSTPATPPSYSDFNATDRSAPPSARRPGEPEHTLPPHHRRRPEQQQQKTKRNDLFGSGSAMLQLGMKTAVPHLRPPACRAVPANLVSDGGGPPSAGLLPAGHSLIPARPPAVSPSAGLSFNFNGPDSRLPAAGRPWSGRHLLAPHCSVIRLRSMLGKQPTNRLLSTIPDPVIKEINLLSVEKGESAGNEISSGIQDAVEKVARLDGNIQKLSAINLKETLQRDLEECKKHQSKERLKKLYYKKIRPALIARGLLSPYSLSDDRGIKLLNEYKDCVSKVKYLTSIDLMEEMTKLTESYWSLFLDFLSEERCLVIEDWDNSLGASFGTTLYKRGVTFDGSPIYRGECDASFVEDKENKDNSRAMICIAIWTSASDILSSIVVKDYPCNNSVEAEGVAMFLLLKEGFRLGLNLYPFEACSDCQLVFNTLWGAHRIGLDDKNADLLKLLKYMRRYYKSLMPEWQQREKMFWVDGVMRVMDIEGTSDDKVELQCLLKKMRSYLSGKLVFKFAQKSGSFDNLIKRIREQSRQSSPLDSQQSSQHLSPPLDLHQRCQLEVEEKNKADILSHIITALRPSRIFIVMKESQSEARNKILKMYEDCKIDEISEVSENCRMISFNVKHRTISKTAKKDLWISFDSSIPEGLFQNKSDSLMVFLRTPSEIDVGTKLPELSPVSFVSFHKTTSPAAEKKRSPHPNTKWTQRSDKLLLVIELPESKDIIFDLKPEGHFHFSAKGADDMPYELDLELFDAVNLEEIKKLVGPKDVRYLVKKADSKLWPRLLKKEGKPPAFLKIDSKLDMRAAASDVQNDENEVPNGANEVRSKKEANEDVGGNKVEQSKGEEAPTGAAKEEKP